LIETGTQNGDGIERAKSLGFNKILSIEVSKILCDEVRQRFWNDNNITIICGDSTVILWPTIKSIKERMTFILDAHGPCPSGDVQIDYESCPLTKELQIIMNHSHKDHTIIIDDVRLFESSFDTTIEEVKALLFKINPNYQFCFAEGLAGDDIILINDILIAEVIDNGKIKE
ncbi:MAG: hypothetical protein QQN41_02785, partial [Nitrosopumilus sp.]